MSDSEGSDIEMIGQDDLSGITSTQVLKRVNALLKLDEDHTDITKKLEEQIRQLELQFQPQFDAIYKKRSAIIVGETESDEVPKEPLEVPGLKSGEEKGIPGFWFKAMSNHPAFAEVIGEEDDDVMQHLTNVTIVEQASTDAENQGFEATFHFAPNSYFTNTSISITLTVKDGDLESIKSTPVEWNEGKKFYIRTVEKQEKKKGPKGKRPTIVSKMVTETIPSVFSKFFVEIDKSQEDEESAQNMYAQYQALISLKDDIIPEAVNYFLGRAEPEGMDDGMGMYGEDFDDEDFDEDEDDEVPVKKGKGAAPPQPNNPECKQQ